MLNFKKAVQVGLLGLAVVTSGVASAEMRQLKEGEAEAVTWTLGFCSAYTSIYVDQYPSVQTQELADRTYDINEAFYFFADMIDGYGSEEFREVEKIAVIKFLEYDDLSTRQEKHDEILSYCEWYIGKVHDLQEGRG